MELVNEERDEHHVLTDGVAITFGRSLKYSQIAPSGVAGEKR